MSERRFRKPCVIVNPKAASGKALRRWLGLQPVFETNVGPADVRITDAPNHATELAREAIRGGADLVVAVGGDGTFNEVVNGYLEKGAPLDPHASLAICPLGTGGDFRRSARIPDSPVKAIERIASLPLRKIDACEIAYSTSSGTTAERYFANVTSFGMGGEVSVAAKRNFLTAISGRAAFLWATALTFFRYRAKDVRLAFDGEPEAWDYRVIQVSVGNGSHQGGGMRVCPLARVDSGTIEVTVIEDTRTLDFLRSLPLLYSGKVYSHPKCHRIEARSMVAVSKETVLIEVDGEAVGQLPVAIAVLPGALSLAGFGTGIFVRKEDIPEIDWTRFSQSNL